MGRNMWLALNKQKINFLHSELLLWSARLGHWYLSQQVGASTGWVLFILPHYQGWSCMNCHWHSSNSFKHGCVINGRCAEGCGSMWDQGGKSFPPPPNLLFSLLVLVSIGLTPLVSWDWYQWPRGSKGNNSPCAMLLVLESPRGEPPKSGAQLLEQSLVCQGLSLFSRWLGHCHGGAPGLGVTAGLGCGANRLRWLSVSQQLQDVTLGFFFVGFISTQTD